MAGLLSLLGATHPAPGYRLVVTLLSIAEDDLGNDTVTKHDKDECP